MRLTVWCCLVHFGLIFRAIIRFIPLVHCLRRKSSPQKLHKDFSLCFQQSNTPSKSFKLYYQSENLKLDCLMFTLKQQLQLLSTFGFSVTFSLFEEEQKKQINKYMETKLVDSNISILVREELRKTEKITSNEFVARTLPLVLYFH